MYNMYTLQIYYFCLKVERYSNIDDSHLGISALVHARTLPAHTPTTNAPLRLLATPFKSESQHYELKNANLIDTRDLRYASRKNAASSHASTGRILKLAHTKAVFSYSKYIVS